MLDLHGMAVVRSFACGMPAVDVAFSAQVHDLLHTEGNRLEDLGHPLCVVVRGTKGFVIPRPIAYAHLSIYRYL